MEVLTLNNSNFSGISAKYIYDDTLDLPTTLYTSYEGLNVFLVNALSATTDTSTNKHSSFILSDTIQPDSFVSIKKTTNNREFTFTTYLAAFTLEQPIESTYVINTVYDETNTVAYKLQFNEYNTAPLHYFTISVNNTSCTVSQTINGETYYLTYFASNSGDTMFLMVKGYQSDDQNLFDIIYDSEQHQVVLSKTSFGITKYVAYDISTGYLYLADYTPTNNLNVGNYTFRVRNINDIDFNLKSDWYSYVKQIDKDGLIVNNNRTITDVSLNYLFSLTNEKLTDNALPINVIPLNNDKDTKNSLSRGDIINTDKGGVIHRKYGSLNTGTTQVKGSVDFNTTYNAFTNQIAFKGDHTTFFYFPYEPFPVLQLNINDSSLVDSGAIAGDTPYNADKVFKHKVVENFAKPFNTLNTEQNGVYLCSWLKGGVSLSAKPIWVDRYYNPTQINAINAIYYNTNAPYITQFQQLSGVNPNNISYPVYDVTSSLTFEPGIQYAYQHLGDTNILELIESLSASRVIQHLNSYVTTKGQEYTYLGNELTLGNDRYSKLFTTTQLSAINQYNNFTITFDLSFNNWDNVLGYQLLGNYNNNGFGMFNYQQITPFVYTFSDDIIYAYNTDLHLLDTIKLDSTIKHISKLDPVGSIIAIDNNNKIYKINYNSVIVDTAVIVNLSDYTGFVSTLECTYAFSLTHVPLKINNNTLNYQAFTGSIVTVVVPDFTATTGSIAVINDVLYNIPGYNVKCSNEKIYFVVTIAGADQLCVYDTAKEETTTIYYANVINDYFVNEDGSIYMLYNNNKLILSDQYYRILTSTGFPTNIFSDISTLSALDYKGIDEVQVLQPNGVIEYGLCFIGIDTDTRTKYIVRTNKFTSIADIHVTSTVTSTYVDEIGGVLNCTNSNFNRNNLTKQGQLEFRFSLANVYDQGDLRIIRTIIDTDRLEYGSHSFAIRFDSVKGVYLLMIDGDVIHQTVIQPGQYSFYPVLTNPFLIGNCIYYNNLTLGEYVLKPTEYVCNTFSIKNVYVYNAPLYYYEILLHLKLNYPISDVLFEIPVGKRCFVETIQHFFKFKTPGFKSNKYNINITGLDMSDGLKAVVTDNINTTLKKVTPGYTELNELTYD